VFRRRRWGRAWGAFFLVEEAEEIALGRTDIGRRRGRHPGLHRLQRAEEVEELRILAVGFVLEARCLRFALTSENRGLAARFGDCHHGFLVGFGANPPGIAFALGADFTSASRCFFIRLNTAVLRASRFCAHRLARYRNAPSPGWRRG
jgi:hypothetical protein